MTEMANNSENLFLLCSKIAQELTCLFKKSILLLVNGETLIQLLYSVMIHSTPRYQASKRNGEAEPENSSRGSKWVSRKDGWNER